VVWQETFRACQVKAATFYIGFFSPPASSTGLRGRDSLERLKINITQSGSQEKGCPCEAGYGSAAGENFFEFGAVQTTQHTPRCWSGRIFCQADSINSPKQGVITLQGLGCFGQALADALGCTAPTAAEVSWRAGGCGGSGYRHFVRSMHGLQVVIAQ